MSVTAKVSTFVMNEEHLTQQIDEIREKLAGEGPEVLLDFFLAQILVPADIKSLEELAGQANILSVKVVLRGVNVEMYKVLKLAGLTDRFCFID